MLIDLIGILLSMLAISVIVSLYITNRARRRAMDEIGEMMATDYDINVVDDIDDIDTDVLTEPPYALIRGLQQQGDALDNIYNMAASSHAHLIAFTKLGISLDKITGVRKANNSMILQLKNIYLKQFN
ncbi:MAG: hypothetical protein Q8O72_10475 [Bacteroidales bacterium]|nr:hypothetical protein [Bacteroidales bacterium]